MCVWVLPVEMMSDSLSQSMLAGGMALTLHLHHINKNTSIFSPTKIIFYFWFQNLWDLSLWKEKHQSCPFFCRKCPAPLMLIIVKQLSRVPSSTHCRNSCRAGPAPLMSLQLSRVPSFTHMNNCQTGLIIRVSSFPRILKYWKGIF